MPEVWSFHVQQGAFWPGGDPRRGWQFAVLGPTLKRELFGDDNALGEFVRVGGVRFRVVGVMTPKGTFLGLDIDDAIYLPVASALRLFNLDELTEIDVLYAHPDLAQRVEENIRQVLIRRHRGNEDFTLVTQAAMLEVFDNVMTVITLSVGAIGGISLLVGAIGILTMMWIAVAERTPEIGLARAIGASRHQVQVLFLAEAGALATGGGLLGIAGGLGLAALLRELVPGLPVETPPLFVALALVFSLATGLASGWLPARRAAGLDPIEALREE